MLTQDPPTRSPQTQEGSEITITRHCPACDSAASAPMDGDSSQMVASKPSAETVGISQLRDYWRGFFKEKSFFTYRRCQKCGILFCPVYLSDQKLSEFYREMPDNTAGVPMTAIERTNRDYFKLLRKHVRLTGKYLELGPDIGIFARICADKTHFEKILLLEPNIAVHGELKKRFTGEPAEYLSDPSALDQVEDGSLSVVVMIHVLDHLLEPKPVLRKLHSKLRPGGTLFIVTHDEGSLLAKALGPKWPAFCMQHPQLYNPSSIRSTLAHTGFRTRAVEKCRNYFPIFYLAKHLLWALGLKKMPLPELPSLQLGLKLGNIATIAVKGEANAS